MTWACEVPWRTSGTSRERSRPENIKLVRKIIFHPGHPINHPHQDAMRTEDRIPETLLKLEGWPCGWLWSSWDEGQGACTSFPCRTSSSSLSASGASQCEPCDLINNLVPSRRNLKLIKFLKFVISNPKILSGKISNTNWPRMIIDDTCVRS